MARSTKEVDENTTGMQNEKDIESKPVKFNNCRYENYKVLCKDYRAHYKLFLHDIKEGYSVFNALKNHCKALVVDNFGHVFRSRMELSEHHNISTATFGQKLRSGEPADHIINELSGNTVELMWTDSMADFEKKDARPVLYCDLEELSEFGITIPDMWKAIHLRWNVEHLKDYVAKWGYVDCNVKDHTGREFLNVTEMCEHWHIFFFVFVNRIKNGWSTKDALEKKYTVLEESEYKVDKDKYYDHKGIKNSTEKGMCLANAVDLKTYQRRRYYGWELDRALETKNDVLMDVDDYFAKLNLDALHVTEPTESTEVTEPVEITEPMTDTAPVETTEVTQDDIVEPETVVEQLPEEIPVPTVPVVSTRTTLSDTETILEVSVENLNDRVIKVSTEVVDNVARIVLRYEKSEISAENVEVTANDSILLCTETAPEVLPEFTGIDLSQPLPTNFDYIRLAEEKGVSPTTLYKWFNKGWSLEDIKSRDSLVLIAGHPSNDDIDNELLASGMIRMSYMDYLARTRLYGQTFKEMRNFDGTVESRREFSVDHLGNQYKSYGLICRAYGISEGQFVEGIRNGMTLEDILNIPNERELDIRGVEYASFDDLLDTYEMDYSEYKRKRCMYLEWDEILLSKTPRQGYAQQATTGVYLFGVTDHQGNTFKSCYLMCRAYGVSVITFIARVFTGWSLKDALETPDDLMRRSNYVVDLDGTPYRSYKDIARHYDMTTSIVYNRLKNFGWELEDALTTPETKRKKRQNEDEVFIVQ